MKYLKILLAALLFSTSSYAQHEMAFPFQGGKDVMLKYFKDNITIPAEIKQKKASGTAVIKFTADPDGTIQKIVVYYADDYLIAIPIIDALKKSNHKWVIPDEEKLHDFLISFTVNLALKGKKQAAVEKQMYQYYSQRHPILASNPVPLDMTTLLPAISTSYAIDN